MSPNDTSKALRHQWLAPSFWAFIALGMLGACTTFGSTTPNDDAAAPNDASASDAALADSSVDPDDVREAAARPDAHGGDTGMYVCGEPAVIGSFTVPSDCQRALGDAGCLASSNPKTGDPCAPSTTQNGTISRCACVSDRLERVTCTCR